MSGFKQQIEGFSTKAIHVEQETDSWSNKAIVQPIVTTAIFRQTEPDIELVSGLIDCLLNDFFLFILLYWHQPHFYSRYGNPTRSLLEKCLASLDGGKYAVAFSSGQGTISSVAAILETGDHVLCAEGIYSGTTKLLNDLLKNGIESDLVDFTDLTNVKRGIKTNTRVGIFS